jgi:hypothetical protein
MKRRFILYRRKRGSMFYLEDKETQGAARQQRQTLQLDLKAELSQDLLRAMGAQALDPSFAFVCLRRAWHAGGGDCPELDRMAFGISQLPVPPMSPVLPEATRATRWPAIQAWFTANSDNDSRRGAMKLTTPLLWRCRMAWPTAS